MNNPENTPEEKLHQLGSFDPADAKRILAALEAAAIPFEVEADHSALAKPGRSMELYLGMFPEGSKLAVFVPASSLDQAQTELRALFPV